MTRPLPRPRVTITPSVASYLPPEREGCVEVSGVSVVVRRRNDSETSNTSLRGHGDISDQRFVLVNEPLSRVFTADERAESWLVEITYPVPGEPDALELLRVKSWQRGKLKLPAGAPPDAVAAARARSMVALELAGRSKVPFGLIPPPIGTGFPCNMFNFPWCA